MMRLLKLLCIFLLFYIEVSAQEFGGNPPSVKWRQVNIPEARIIFPKGLDSTARRVATIVSYLNRHTGVTAGNAHRKINIVLQNQTIQSNGYVGLAPWRSEFYLTPQFNSFQLGSLQWADNLAAHEYRHVQQYMNFRKGLSKAVYYILGEEGQAVANNVAIPNWFFEGDAVFQETAVSGQGRGRIPYFFNGYRSLWSAGKQYSFMKLRNGSFKDYIPDHYALGYLMVGYGREKWGEAFWTKATDDAARFRGVFYPWQKAVKKYSGIPYRDFVKSALSYYQEQDKALPAAGTALWVTPATGRYVSNYTLPVFAGNDSLLLFKRTYREAGAWYWLINGKEEKIRTKDIAADDYYSYRNGKIVYTAYEPDARWGQRDYNVIRLMDVRTKQVRQLTKKSKYFSPDLSPDGKKIVAISYLPDQRTALHILSTDSARVLKEIPGNELVFTYPKFLDDDRIVSCIRDADGRMSVAVIDISSNTIDNLTAWSYEIKGYPFVKGDTVYFSASNGYRDDIYAVSIAGRQLYKLSNEYLGAYQPAVNETGSLVWSSFTAEGYRLKQKQLTAADWVPVAEPATAQARDLYLPNALRQTGGNILQEISPGDFPVSKYGKATRLFNFHSWRPYYEQPDWSFTLYGQNVLNTFQSRLYYSFNENERSHTAGAGATLATWFPWVTGGISYTFDRKVSDSARTIHWNELNANIGLSLPLNFTRGRWYKNLTLASSFNVEQLAITGKYKDSVASPLFNYLQFSLNWSSQVQRAVQHINPRFAQTLLFRYRTVVNEHTARQLLASGSLYFPGLGVNHSLVLSAAFQQRDTANQYRFSNNFPFARGYDGIDAPRMWKWAANYHFPVVYPDWGFGQILYFLRVRGNIFFDYAQAQSLRTLDIFSFRSAGAEIYFDTKWWNQQPVTFGLRYSRLLDDNIAGVNSPGRWEFILPVDLFSR
ncbi:MAG: hypothetical protein KF862_00865 [Chitinophagaceae bacterium]|nr:hypothetical protein [Chitinophagaceae bacterium]